MDSTNKNTEQPASHIAKNKSTKEGREFWAHVESIASQVSLEAPGQQAGAEIPADLKELYIWASVHHTPSDDLYPADVIRRMASDLIQRIARAEAELRLSRESRLGHDVELQFLRTEIVSLRSQLAAAQLKAEEE